ncbi:MAG TPA: hypothetical protein VHQ86_02400, partial [Candidatus Saccharimonadia bacterium]|nr:hypothetical protein [Candidatus Saccharimonadia bacterium]
MKEFLNQGKILTSGQKFSPHRLTVFLGVFVMVGGLVVTFIQAAGPGAGYVLSSATLSGNAGVVTNASAVGGHMVVFGQAATPTPTPTPGGTVSLSLPRVPWEGGPSYYGNFSKAAVWNNANFFPVGVWYESVLSQSDANTDKAAGLNTYIEMTSNSNPSFIRTAGGMYTVPSETLSGYGSEDVGWLITDEADMNYGAGNDAWDQHYNDTVSTWNSCIPIQDNGGKCGYTAMATMKSQRPQGDGRAFYTNYGKGVMMWEDDAEAAAFVNNYTNFVSADMYFYTDPNLCGGESQTWLSIPTNQCRMSANYGFVIDRMRSLDAMDGKRQPIFAFVEDGCPFNNGGCITAPQIA